MIGNFNINYICCLVIVVFLNITNQLWYYYNIASYFELKFLSKLLNVLTYFVYSTILFKTIVKSHSNVCEYLISFVTSISCMFMSIMLMYINFSYIFKLSYDQIKFIKIALLPIIVLEIFLSLKKMLKL